VIYTSRAIVGFIFCTDLTSKMSKSYSM